MGKYFNERARARGAIRGDWFFSRWARKFVQPGDIFEPVFAVITFRASVSPRCPIWGAIAFWIISLSTHKRKRRHSTRSFPMALKTRRCHHIQRTLALLPGTDEICQPRQLDGYHDRAQFRTISDRSQSAGICFVSNGQILIRPTDPIWLGTNGYESTAAGLVADLLFRDLVIISMQVS